MIQKIQIISNNVCYGPPPVPGAEIEQRLTVSANGRIWFTGYNYIDRLDKLKKGRSLQISIGKENAQKILAAIEKFTENDIFICVTDCGSWELKVTDGSGKWFSASGPLIGNSEYISISNKLRTIIPIEDVFLFDGNNVEE